MPLTPIQREVVEVLRPYRTSVSYVAGGVSLNRFVGLRLSDDLDIFQDQEGSLPEGVEQEIQALRAAGFSISRETEYEFVVDINVSKNGDQTKIEWVFDDEYCRRFHPAEVDDELGYRLHPADAAVNKVVCASRRRQAARDAVDIMAIVNAYAPLGPLVLAAAGKTNISPVALLRDLHARVREISEPEIRSVRMEDGAQPPQWAEIRAVVGEAVVQAERYFDDSAPSEYVGHLLVDADGRPVEADEQAIKRGEARALPLTTFSPIVVVR